MSGAGLQQHHARGRGHVHLVLAGGAEVHALSDRAGEGTGQARSRQVGDRAGTDGAAMTERICPVPGCGATAKSGHLMCRACWFTVPPYIRASVNRTWRAFSRGGFGLKQKREDYDRACQGAIAAVVQRR
jgi:hypothetical protein